jgi:hypothetical protein
MADHLPANITSLTNYLNTAQQLMPHSFVGELFLRERTKETDKKQKKKRVFVFSLPSS